MDRLVLRKSIFMIILSFSMSVYSQTEDEWVEWPPGPYVYEGFVEVGQDHLFGIQERYQSESMEKLEDQKFVTISEDVARRYVGNDYLNEKGRKPYLIRAVYGHATGRYVLFKRNQEYFLLHASLGKSSPRHRAAMVINVKGKMENLFIGVNIAE